MSDVMRFRRKPVEIEAIHFTGDVLPIANAWPDGPFALDFDGDGGPVLKIHTLEGVMTAIPGDWIICGVAGDFYPCRGHIFRATYEPVTEARPVSPAGAAAIGTGEGL
jgi:hypothetical protein